MKIEDLIQDVKGDIALAERKLKKEISTVRSILDRIENTLENEKSNFFDGLQGNEWRIYDEISKIESLTNVLKNLEKLNGNIQ